MARTALITGGGRRIGQAIALSLAEKGYSIALHYRQSESSAKACLGRIEAMGGECTLFQADFSIEKDLTGLMDHVFARFPECSLLVNNASLFERTSFLESEYDLFNRLFAVNVKAPFFLSRDFARRCHQGQIINVIDTKITQNPVDYFVYVLTKKSLYDFTRLAAKSLGPDIRVNAVCPGLILPPSGQEDKNAFERMGRRIPLRRTGSVEDVLKAIRFLLESPFVTGECVFVDGGENLL